MTPAGSPASAARSSASGRLHSLDALRGTAALVVIVWHWQHFFFDARLGNIAVVLDKQPFFATFARLYTSGWLAVDLFFALSGFVFFALYSAAIAERREGAGTFAIKRLSRLYPLHLATFALVAILQLIYMQRHLGVPFVYPEFNAYHALLNVAGASSWGLEKGISFNGPFWSVSVELMLYAMFFVLCRWHSPSFVAVALCSAAGVLLMKVYPPLGRGVYAFFLGGLGAIAYRALGHGKWRSAGEVASVLACAGAWVAVLSGTFKNAQAEIQFSAAFAITVLALALTEHRWARGARILAPLGDISYAVYLLHFPLQLLFVIALEAAGMKTQAFYAPEAFVTFIVVLIAVSVASYRWFERPAQDWIRKRWILRRPPPADSVARAEA